jgi:hypothetical protein
MSGINPFNYLIHWATRAPYNYLTHWATQAPYNYLAHWATRALYNYLAHWATKFTSCLPMGGGSLRVLRLLPTLKLVAII